MNIPKDLKYTKKHEWVRIEGDDAIIGITDYAQGELTDIVYVEPPEIGSELNKGEELGVVESVKAASEFYTPVSGEVIEVNEDLENSPELMNSDPYGKGWMAKLKTKNLEELGTLLDAESYEKHVEEEEKTN